MMSILENVKVVQRHIAEAVIKRGTPASCRLVAVSKTKPVQDVIDAYNAGVRDFGENYIQELVEKSNNSQIVELCPEIKWHFIGHLQSNKVKLLSNVKNLSFMETVDSVKLSDKINNEFGNINQKLQVLVQVNTSGESQKSGVEPSELSSLVNHIRNNCPNLLFKGVMTIGAYDFDVSKGPNPDFLKLVSCRDDLVTSNSLSDSEIEVSMGMSSDYVHAIELGSTNVRVGSTIFGARY